MKTLRITVVLGLIALVASLAVACGNDEDEAPRVAPTSTAQPVATQPVVTEATPMVEVMKQQGEFRWATDDITDWCCNFVPKLNAISDPYSIKEPLFYHAAADIPFRGGIDPERSIGIEWSLSSDLTKLTVTIREGVPFHNDWGDVTNEDVAWSFNNALEEGNVNKRSGFWGSYIKEVEAVGSQTVVFTANADTIISPRWHIELSNTWRNTQSIQSKKAYDQLGEEKAGQTAAATGPFKAVKWDVLEGIEAEALPTHYREAANVEFMKVLVIPDAAAKAAAFQTGEVDIAFLPNTLIKEAVEAAGGRTQRVGFGSATFLFFGGNFWATTSRTEPDKEIFPRPGLRPDDEHPWIGDPRDPARMESARKVRLAMAMAIDRDTLSNVIEGGLALPALTYTGFDKGHPLFKPEYDIPFDPVKAKQLLDEAGYPSGFEVPVWIVSDRPQFLTESAQAALEMWRDHLGLTPKIEATKYAGRRPSLIDRSVDIPFLHARSVGDDEDPKGRLLSSDLGGANRGIELEDDILDKTWYTGTAATDSETVIEANVMLQDYLSKWTLMAPSVIAVSNVAVGPRVAEWRPWTDDVGSPNAPETIVLR